MNLQFFNLLSNFINIHTKLSISFVSYDKGICFIQYIYYSVMQWCLLRPFKIIYTLFLLEVWWWKTCLWISILWSSEKKNEWFWLVDFIVHPSSALSDTEDSPFHLIKKFVSWNLLVHILRQKHMPVLIQVITVFLAILDFVWEMWHQYKI